MKLSARLRPLPLLGKKPELGRVYSEIRADLDRVERKLRDLSRSSVRLISEVGGYLFQKSGKRIRPALVLLCSKAFGARDAERIMLSSLVELVHTASLIHDDIIDNSGTRRGKATLHAKWGPNVTVLLGDHLYIKSINLSLGCRSPRVTAILTDVSVRMIEGEIQEFEASGRLDLAERDYLDIIGKKTAALFSASCRLGGILGGATARQENALAEYGLNLGLCFQLVDDILDYTGEENRLGKPVLADMAEGRITLPLIYALGRDGSALAGRVKKVLADGKDDLEARRDIAGRVRSLGGVTYALDRAAAFCQRSKDSLAALPRSACTESLALLADFVLSRDH